MKSIRTKLVFWICVLFLLIGALIYLPLSNILPKKITSQILKRDVEIAKYLSDEAKDLLLLNDRVALSLLLHDNLDRLEDAQYSYIQAPDGSIISHTFTKGFPKGLLPFKGGNSSPYQIKEFLSDGRRIYDISIPILKGEIGALHLGVSMESGKKDIAEITKINYYVAMVILIGLGAGIIVFLIIGFLFSRQIIRLKNFVTRVGRGDLEAKVDITSKDEIGTLASAFNEMAMNLKEKIQEIKRLNTIEERNRIAFDLHDGCAQDMANIIKRLELCEKLFTINSAKAVKELAALKESTKDALNRTRQVIFSLKESETADFDLLSSLHNYLEDYQKQNDIEVKLDLSGSVDNIAPDKSKSIFYIITEALSNIRKHSAARNIELSLKTGGDNNLTLNIRDDGKGFDIEHSLLNTSKYGKLGLISMCQRANSLGGEIAIESGPRQGTAVSVNIPLAKLELGRA